MSIPEPTVIDPLESGLGQQLSTWGKVSGIYAFMSADGMTHLSSSTNLSRRLRRLLCAAGGGPTALANRLGENRMAVGCWVTSSRLESLLLLYKLARLHFPHDYMTRLRLRMPWFVALTDVQQFPRLIVTNRLTEGSESAIGPFPSRETAQRYEEELLTGFSIRRCWEELHPAPDHPGCLYGEIKLCSRPCQGAVSQKEYRRETDAVKNFLLTNGRDIISSLALARNQAATNTDFETAAQIHKRIEKLKTAAKSRDAIITDLESFHGVAVTRGLKEHQLRLWPIWAGFWQEPIVLQVASSSPAASSLDRSLRDLLPPTFNNPNREGQEGENLAIFSRWYYSSWRDGEWISLPPQLDNKAYRKLLRSVIRMAKTGVNGEPV